jgi:ABC-type maltose transport system permease subunit
MVSADFAMPSSSISRVGSLHQLRPKKISIAYAPILDHHKPIQASPSYLKTWSSSVVASQSSLHFQLTVLSHTAYPFSRSYIY